MRISSIAPLNNNITIKSKMQTNAARVTNFAEDNNKKNINKNEKTIAFKGTLIKKFLEDNEEYLYKKSLSIHKHRIEDIDPFRVELYFWNMDIPCRIQDGSKKTKQVIAYCLQNAAEIFKQINMVLPTEIDMEEMGNNVIAGCYHTPGFYHDRKIRTVVFNTNFDWENLLEKSYDEYKQDHFHTTGHFMHTFLHEFGHNVHFHKLYSKFGCPFENQGYDYKPEVAKKMEALRMPIYNEFGDPVPQHPYVTKEARDIMKQSSGYGSKLLPELFAEEFTKTLISCLRNTDLRLYQNPFPIIAKTPELQQVLYETWEGLIDDNEGLIKNLQKNKNI